MRIPYASINKVPPSINLFSPKFEGIKKMKISTISKRQFYFTVFDETFDCQVIVIDVRISD
jgi:hypothetical protein